jgi:DUF971 family protein
MELRAWESRIGVSAWGRIGELGERDSRKKPDVSQQHRIGAAHQVKKTGDRLSPIATVARIELMQPGLENMTPIGDELALRWTDGRESYFPLEFLRKRCPCALCAGETDLLGNIYKGKVDLAPASFQLKRCAVVGGYGIQPEWSDGHSSGIYSFSYLRSLDPSVA